MVEPANPELRREIAAVLDWWREAGVDRDFSDEATAMLAAPAAEPAARAPGTPAPARSAPAMVAEAAPVRLDLSGMPGELAAFRDWWLREPALDDGRVHARVPPRGPAQAELMILVGDPEPEDEDRLLSGPHGRLVDAFLTAAGVAPDQVYFASVLPRATPHADWAGIAAAGFGMVLARHIALAGPRRIVAFNGSDLPLTGNDWPNTPQSLLHFNHDGTSIPLFAARGLTALLERPRWKAGLWQGWLDLTRAG